MGIANVGSNSAEVRSSFSRLNYKDGANNAQPQASTQSRAEPTSTRTQGTQASGKNIRHSLFDDDIADREKQDREREKGTAARHVHRAGINRDRHVPAARTTTHQRSL
jgi:hypothetical protein